MIYRNLTAALLEALTDTPVVLIHGARQTGKSTLARQILEREHPAQYFTLDEATVLAAAQADPDGFIRTLSGPVVIDEVQRAPELFRAIKAEVDRNRAPGRFLLTGSADVLLLPGLSESLAGRMEILTLWPFSQGEIEGAREGFVDAVFEDGFPVPGVHLGNAVVGREPLLERARRGGYPEILRRPTAHRRRAWFEAYLTTILQRDIRDLADIEGLSLLPRLLALLALRTGSTLNYSEVSRTSGIAQTTLKRYVALLEAAFLLKTIPAWHGNLSKRLARSPKLMLSDPGLAAHLIGLGDADFLTDAPLNGPILENFVAMELVRQIGWSDRRPDLFHYRTQAGREVDLVLEDARGRLVGIEVKASASVSPKDFSGLRALAEAEPDGFHRGVVLYAGDSVVGFAPNLHAVPIPALWRWPK